MASDKEFGALARTVLKQKVQLEGAARMLAAISRVVAKSVAKCRAADCGRLAVVVHRYTEIAMCERCAARAVVKAKNDYLASDESDPLQAIRGSMMNEHDWTTVDEAESISMIQDYIDTTAEIDTEERPREIEGLN